MSGGDTFWSDSIDVCMSDRMDSSIEGPHQVVTRLAEQLRALGHNVSLRESHPGTKNINHRLEAIIEAGADHAVVGQIEEYLSANGIRFTKHSIVNDSDHVDLHYDLTNVPVWKS
jgi:hypothetical protein